MQEIAHGIYFEDAYLGVTLGAISLPHGLILIDAPPRPDDVRTWRSALLNLGGGVDRLLVNLDSHIDRTLGARAMECTVVAHEKTSQVFRNRPTAFKAQNTETGAEWEQINGLGSIRWAPPEVTFSHQMLVHWGDYPVSLEHHPGPNPGAIWIVLDGPQVIFLGDAVVPNQPPFLGSADLPAWIDTLQPLLSSKYRDYSLVSGRNGLVSQDEVRKQLELLKQVNNQMEKIAEGKEPPEATERLVPKLLSRIELPADRRDMYAHRLRWGLYHYYARRYRPSTVEGEE
jgi:glyoxylase-like metal-dependent hydrolase (beta-lactamase superfamily II)